MSDDPSHREIFNARLQAQDQIFGNVLSARAVMEGVWQHRDTDPNTAVVDWRGILQDRGHLLFI